MEQYKCIVDIVNKRKEVTVNRTWSVSPPPIGGKIHPFEGSSESRMLHEI